MNNELATIPVPGSDATLVATLIDGKPYVALKPMCETLGIDTWTQQRKLNGRSWATTSMMTAVAADGKQQMVAAGAALVLAFPWPGPRRLSRGTWDCVDRARAVGIPVEVVDLEGQPRLDFEEVR